MQWIHGGHWHVEQIELLHASSYRAVLLQPVPPGGNRGLLDARVAARRFGDGSTRWADLVGEPARLEEYELDDRRAERILDTLHKVCVDFWHSGLPLEEREDRDALIGQALQLTQAFGPLGPVKGVLELPTGDVDDPADGVTVDPSPLRGSFDLDEWWDAVTAFGDAWHSIKEPRSKAEKRVLFDRMLRASGTELRETVMSPELTDDGIMLRGRPLTLRAFLWKELFEWLDTAPRGWCKLCGNEFNVVTRVGRPAAYCEQHRGGAFREAASQKRKKQARVRADSRKAAAASRQ